MQFTASVQYDDWKGTVAADTDDFAADLRERLEQNNNLGADQRIVGVRAWFERIPPNEDPVVSLTAFVVSAESPEKLRVALQSDDPPALQEVRTEMTLSEFFRLFKRFEISMTPHEQLTVGRHYDIATTP
jgi:hypothetical protein